MDSYKSDHFNGERFFNLDSHGPNDHRPTFMAFLKWQLGRQRKKWPRWIEDCVPYAISDSVKDREVRSTWVNHVTHLIQFSGVNILTDPLFSKRTSPFRLVGPKRHRRPGIKLKQLPRIDVVAVSHNHYDHMDESSLRFLARNHQPLVVTPLGNGQILRQFGLKNIVELDWWQSMSHSSGLHIHVVPAQHWSSRWPGDYCKALWSGFVFEHQGLKVYFAGDTGFGRFFELIEKRFGGFDLSHLPIGAYEPRDFMKYSHMNPAEAVQAHKILQSKLTIGNHFGSFQLTDEGIDDPVHDLAKARLEQGVTESEFTTLKHGANVRVKRT